MKKLITLVVLVVIILLGYKYINTNKNSEVVEDVIDNTSVLEEETPIENIVKSSNEYKELFEGYEKLVTKDNKIFFTKDGKKFEELVGADVKTFRSLDGKVAMSSYKEFYEEFAPYDYSEKKQYFEYKYYIDEDQAWYLHGYEEYGDSDYVVMMGNVNTASLKKLTNGFLDDENFMTDGEKVFYVGREFKGANPNTLKRIVDNYFTDGNNVYFYTNILQDADPKSFVVEQIDRSYGISGDKYKYTTDFSYDKKNLYFLSNKIGDASTYVMLSPRYRKDKNNVFYLKKGCEGDYGYNIKISNADPKTFKVMFFEPISISEAIGYAHIGYDKNYVFESGVPNISSDPKTLEIISDRKAKDKNNEYSLELDVCS